jgi:hypothetical protein
MKKKKFICPNCGHKQKFYHTIYVENRRTKSDQESEIQVLGNDLLLEISSMIENSDNTADFEANICNIIMAEKYSMCSSENFELLCAIATTYINSLGFWQGNIEEIIGASSIPDTKTWKEFWSDVKRLARADAEQACAVAPGAILAGPAAVEVIFATAAVGSAIECADMISERI